MKISAVIKEMVGWEDLAGWLAVGEDEIRAYCMRESDLAHCYRRRLVHVYCDRTAKPPHEIAEDIAAISENEMNNKKVANKLRLLIFSEL